MTRWAFWLGCGLLLAAAAAPAAAVDMVEVPCAEHERITGQEICDMVPVVKWEREKWEGRLRALEHQTCRDAVLSKYAQYGIRRADSGAWIQDPRPEHIDPQNWVLCTSPALWNEEPHTCYVELQDCDKR